MDVRNWSLDQIMQLPDHVFGRRFLIYCSSRPAAGSAGYDISEIAFPELCIIWELLIDCTISDTKRLVFKIALGDQPIAAAGLIEQLEPLFPGLGEQGPEPREIHYKGNKIVRWNKLRIPVRTAGRRMVVEFTNTDEASASGSVGIVVSSVPREIPDCLL